MELVVEGWGNFFVAAAGAAGALSGLVFVAVSINLSSILATPGVSGRAAEAIILLASALIGALVGLMPGQSTIAFGIELIVLALPTWSVPIIIQARTFGRRQHRQTTHAVRRFLLHNVATVPMFLAGLSFLGCLGGGMYWLALSLIASLVVGIIGAWVLLLEILR